MVTAQHARKCFVVLVTFCAVTSMSAAQRPPEDGRKDRPQASKPARARDETSGPKEQSAGRQDEAASGKVKASDAEESEEKGAQPALPPVPEPPDPNPTPIDGLKMVTTESGLKYWDIKVGDGEKPHPNAVVKVNYRAWFVDGTLFDSSAQQGYSPSYGRLGVVKGFYEGVWSMRVGGIRRLEIPPELGYGAKGRASLIPPDTALIFEVELLKVKQPPLQTSVDGIKPVATESGLKYWDIKVGEGEKPVPAGVIAMHYAAWLEDGTLIDSSVDRDEPPRIWLDHALPGWAEGASSMRVGGKRRIEIPPDLAYGAAGAGPIPPNATLILELELVGTEPPQPGRKPPSVDGIEPVTTPSGLTYWDIKEGHGRSPGPGATVAGLFASWLPDGTMYGNRPNARRPTTIVLDNALTGLAEGIRSMKVGGKRVLRVPPELAYGKRGRPGVVPPNSALTFEVRLLGFAGERADAAPKESSD